MAKFGDQDDMFCRLHDNKDGTFSFHTRFYNGGTCMSEMVTEALENLDEDNSSFHKHTLINFLPNFNF